jgi:hypothetical protein
LDRNEAIGILKPLFDCVLSFNLDIETSLLSELALMAAGAEPAGPLKRRIHRRYLRLCRISGELGRLDLKKAGPGVSSGITLEDYVFSQIDFSRYGEIDEKEFEILFPEGLTDFDETFFLKNFNASREKIKTLIKENYKKTDRSYRVKRANPMVLSVMRSLETSLDDTALFTPEEILDEIKLLPHYTGGTDKLYPLLVISLDNTLISHEDGMVTKLFISSEGDLAGTFHPGNKPWTRVLISNSSGAIRLL